MMSLEGREQLARELDQAAREFEATKESANFRHLPALLAAAAHEFRELETHLEEGCRIMEHLLALIPDDDDE